MTARDQLKLVKKGFTIMIEDKDNLLIKAKSPVNSNWYTYMKGFTSYASLRKTMSELLKSSNHIEL